MKLLVSREKGDTVFKIAGSGSGLLTLSISNDALVDY